MPAQRVLMVIDMQNGVFEAPRINRDICTTRINQLINTADKVIFIQHTEQGLEQGTAAFDLLAELIQPIDALYVTKTACDAFYRTELDEVLNRHQIKEFVVCGCATDYCVDATIKNGASRGYAMTVAADAHTTANRPAALAEVLIEHYNDVWRNFTIPGNTLRVKSTAEILEQW
ncbi:MULTISPECIES: isochorismatase family protein [Buttiauxella]|jgi:nicotinamidase-related amidase|uniref:isochorismatase family protein n=1 Tax=Buttiauxella TaxID=82976 RepID=UPI00105CF66C|nr:MULTISPECIES: isochorismatase family protein [Buttiauxella]TDN51632.1 nicotinamidase-related amidase [Buttiauxella sp. JUb87]UNK60502.1 isochorismatase family protein [Buttiauxella ferragutiae]